MMNEKMNAFHPKIGNVALKNRTVNSLILKDIPYLQKFKGEM